MLNDAIKENGIYTNITTYPYILKLLSIRHTNIYVMVLVCLIAASECLYADAHRLVTRWIQNVPGYT